MNMKLERKEKGKNPARALKELGNTKMYAIKANKFATREDQLGPNRLKKETTLGDKSQLISQRSKVIPNYKTVSITLST